MTALALRPLASWELAQPCWPQSGLVDSSTPRGRTVLFTRRRDVMHTELPRATRGRREAWQVRSGTTPKHAERPERRCDQGGMIRDVNVLSAVVGGWRRPNSSSSNANDRRPSGSRASSCTLLRRSNTPRSSLHRRRRRHLPVTRSRSSRPCGFSAARANETIAHATYRIAKKQSRSGDEMPVNH